ncbi:MAG: polyprenyl synthetase family protein [Pirellulales bacterium]
MQTPISRAAKAFRENAEHHAITSLLDVGAIDVPVTADRQGAPVFRGGISVVPQPKVLRDRLRAISADLAAAWRAETLPEEVTTPAGLRAAAERVVRRGAGRDEHIGWTMVALVTAYWREQIAEPGGRRLLLLPDCCSAAERGHGAPAICGPQCVYATLASAAVDSGWQVASTRDAVAAMSALLGGRCGGVLGVASLEELEQAFALLPPFAVPIAAVPVNTGVDAQLEFSSAEAGNGCPVEQVDSEWVLGLLGVAGGSVSPVADYLPLLRESAEMFTKEALADLFAGLDVDCARAACQLSTRAAESLPAATATEAIAIDFLARGGKFLRPFMALAAFDAASADAWDRDNSVPVVDRRLARAAATAIEVFHKASLIHDDIEDDDAMRYGRPTMHRDRGVPTAINAGDYLIGLGYRIIAGLDRLVGDGSVDPDAQRDLLSILSTAHLELARGQGAELWWRDAAEKRLSPDEALHIYGLKTSPAFAAALTMGGRLAGLDPKQAGSLRDYALHVGTAFQVQNDLKDWHGDLENLRAAAGDLLGGRPTVLWAIAMQQLSAEDRARLAALAAVADAPSVEQSSQRLQEVRQLYEKADVFARARTLIHEHRLRAAAAAATCEGRRLREVLDFLLDLAVPERAI